MAGRQMNLSLVVGMDTSSVPAGSAEVRREVAGIGDASRGAAADLDLLAAANDEAAASSRRAMEAARGQSAAERDLRAAVSSFAGIKPVNDDAGYRQREADIAAYGAELDRLRAKFVPAAAAEQSLLAEQREINQAFRVGAITAEEQAAALERTRLAHDRVAAAAANQNEEYRRLAIAGREAQAADQAQLQFNSLLGVRGPGGRSAASSYGVFEDAGMIESADRQMQGMARSTALATHEMTNLTYQANDMVMMLLLGQEPLMMFLQQGPQVAQIMGPRGLGEILPALGGALMNLVTPTTLLLGGLMGVGYAGYAAFRMIQPEALDTESVLQRQSDLLDEIAQRYGKVGDAARRASMEGSDLLRLRSSISADELSLMARTEAQSFLSDVTALTEYDPRTHTVNYTLPDEYREFSAAIEDLRESTANGVPDVERFRRMVSERWMMEPNNDQLTRQAKAILDSTAAMVEYVGKLNEVQRAQDEFNRNVDSAGRLRNADWMRDDRSALEQFQRQEALAIRRSQDTFDADLLGLRARSPAEQAEAARAREAARRDDSESAAERRNRIDLAGRRALAEAEHSLAEAARERALSLQEALRAGQLDLDLVGKSAVEVERLRMEHEQLTSLRREAASAGVEASQAEVEAIRAVAAETARLRAIASARDFLQARQEEIEMIRAEISLVSASEQTRARALAALETEQDIRRRGIDQFGDEANRMRENAQAMADYTLELQRTSGAWNSVQRAGESAIDGILDKISDGDLEGALESLADEAKKLMMELAIGNPLKNALLGTNHGTLSDLGGIGGLLSRLFGGGGDATAMGALGAQSVGAMNVAAGTVVINGGVGGLGGNVLRMLTGANDNPASLVGGAGSGGSAVDLASGLLGFNENAQRGSINSFLRAGGVDIDAAQTKWCAAFVNSALEQIGVDGSGSLVANSFLDWGTKIDPAEVLRGDVLVQSNGRGLNQTGGHVGFATGRSRFGPSGLQLEMLSGNAGDAVTADWRDASVLAVRRAEQALDRFGTTAMGATGMLGEFGGGLGQLAQSLMSVGGGHGEGGWFSSLIRMFGGMGGATGYMNSISPLVTRVIAGGGIGLYANGGISYEPAIFGEGALPEAAVPLPDGRTIPVTMRFAGAPMAAAQTSGANITFINRGTPQREVERREEDDGNGGRRTVFVLEDMQAAGMTRPGSGPQKALRSMGVAPRLVRS